MNSLPKSVITRNIDLDHRIDKMSNYSCRSVIKLTEMMSESFYFPI